MTGTESTRVRIGPGRLVMVVGPSGAGKDTLMAAARDACARDSSVVFPRRIVTRPTSVAEDHDTVSDEAFDRGIANGAFALWWPAHGLRYAIPLSIDTDIRAGRTIVCNVSRAIVPQARERYVQVAVVLVTAPAPVLAERLAARGRASDGAVQDRLQRSVGAELAPDLVIENDGTIDAGARKLLQVISG